MPASAKATYSQSAKHVYSGHVVQYALPQVSLVSISVKSVLLVDVTQKDQMKPS